MEDDLDVRPELEHLHFGSINRFLIARGRSRVVVHVERFRGEIRIIHTIDVVVVACRLEGGRPWGP